MQWRWWWWFWWWRCTSANHTPSVANRLFKLPTLWGVICSRQLISAPQPIAMHRTTTVRQSAQSNGSGLSRSVVHGNGLVLLRLQQFAMIRIAPVISANERYMYFLAFNIFGFGWLSSRRRRRRHMWRWKHVWYGHITKLALNSRFWQMHFEC